MRSRRIVLSVMSVFLVAGCASIGSGQPSASPTKSAAYQKAYSTGLAAYTYGLPLLTTNATFLTMTSVNVSQGTYGPVNQFNNVRTPNTASSTAVVAPGATSLSSIAWLDLSTEPQVLQVPKVVGHNFVLAFLDPYTENIVNFGSASSTTPGNYVIAGPNAGDVSIPKGAHRVDVDYDRIWIIGSTQLLNAKDVRTVNAIQDQYKLTPLSAFGTGYRPPTPSTLVTKVTTHDIPTGLAFFDTLGQLLQQFPPPAADAPTLKQFATMGIGPGMSPSQDSSLSADTLQGLTDAVTSGPAVIGQDVKLMYTQDFPKHDGYLLGGFGSYGTNYTERAVISQIGLGAFVPHQAIYAMAWNDAAGQTLDGSKKYLIHIDAAPPTIEGCSLTVYTLKGTLVSNSIGRSALTNLSPLTKNADGSIDIFLSSTEPSAADNVSNWLPTPPNQGFEVTWRLFAPIPDKINGVIDGTGWQPPQIRVQQ